MRVLKTDNVHSELEVWRDVPEYEGLYQVSNLGRIKRLKGVTIRRNGYRIPIPERILNGILIKGYMGVSLSKDFKKKRAAIHRLVAMAFIPNPNNLPIINHKDENKLNNRVENLEWCNHQYNNTYGTAPQRRYITRKENNSLCKPVLQYGLNGIFIKEYPSIKEASETLNLRDSTISLACNCYKRLVTCGGFQWKFKSSDKIITDIRNPIFQFDKDNNLINQFLSVHEASKITGVSNTAIHNCLSGRSNTAGGFIWCRNN